MNEENNEKYTDRPSAQQLQYLIEINRMERRYGTVTTVAQNCGVSPSAVSRFFKKCISNGYMNESYDFTPEGRSWFAFYRDLYKDILSYLARIGTHPQQILKSASSMYENIDPEVLRNILTDNSGRTLPKEKETEVLIEENEPRRYPIYFKILRMAEKDWRQHTRFSMANNGFKSKAWLYADGKNQFVRLQIQDMEAPSRVTGVKMIGHMQTLKYEENGTLVNAEIEGGNVDIPIRDCRLHHSRGGEITGTIPITVTCSIGRLHMPESTALLVFWV